MTCNHFNNHRKSLSKKGKMAAAEERKIFGRFCSLHGSHLILHLVFCSLQTPATTKPPRGYPTLREIWVKARRGRPKKWEIGAHTHPNYRLIAEFVSTFLRSKNYKIVVHHSRRIKTDTAPCADLYSCLAWGAQERRSAGSLTASGPRFFVNFRFYSLYGRISKFTELVLHLSPLAKPFAPFLSDKNHSHK